MLLEFYKDSNATVAIKNICHFHPNKTVANGKDDFLSSDHVILIFPTRIKLDNFKQRRVKGRSRDQFVSDN